MKTKTLHGIPLTLTQKAWVVKVGKPSGNYFQRLDKEEAMRNYCRDEALFSGRTCPNHYEGITLHAETRSKAIMTHIKEAHSYAADFLITNIEYLDYTATRYPAEDMYLLADPASFPRLNPDYPRTLHQFETEILHFLHLQAIAAWAKANPTAEVVVRSHYGGYWGANRCGHGYPLATAGRYLAPDAVSAFGHVCTRHRKTTICYADSGEPVFPNYLWEPCVAPTPGTIHSPVPPVLTGT